MSIVGEAVLTVTMDMLFKKLASEILPLFERQEKIRSDLEDWQRKLKKIKAVLQDAEEKQMTNQSVKIWLCELQNLAYDVEDILDEFAIEALRRKLLHQPDQPRTSKFRKLVPTCCTNFSPSLIEFGNKMSSKIEEITYRLKKITAEKNELDLNEISGGRCKKGEQRLPTTSFVTASKVYGREKEKKEIIDLLLSDDLITEDGFSVIPIVGMGGLGKTTLAQLVYSDQTVDGYFDFKIWVCVSEDFDVIKVTNSILRSIDDKSGNDDDLNRLQEMLKSKLLQKKFFLVLDDVWDENRDKWELLSRPFGAGSPKSKIVVTTRTKDVACIVSNVDTVKRYELNKLSDDDCFPLFTQYSLGKENFDGHQYLKEIGENIVKKCDGLPLAAKALGGLLREKYDRRDWLKVQNSKIWELPEEKCGIMKALRASYHYLPAHLKPCFVYCSLLPKDYEFHEQEVVLLWMAEGLLRPDLNEEKMEDIGHDYFQELQSRSFFQQAKMDTSKFVMHDLINDLAQWAAGEIHFRMEGALDGNKQPSDSKCLRHLSYVIDQRDGTKRLQTISEAEHLRTFLPMKPIFGLNFLSYNVVDELLERKCLRVLSLRGYYISKIQTMQNLIHLRYLDLSETPIITLPEAVNTLYNLHTLLLENCHHLKTLCVDMGNLIKLRHLNNSNTDSLEKMPLGIGKLTCLRTLCHFIVGKNIGSQLQELNSLENLCGKLKISGLENVKDVGAPTTVELNDKQNLQELFLEWSNNRGSSREPGAETHVFDMLRPHENLQQLTIKGYSGTRFPTWLGDSTFSNFVHLIFQGCDMCTCLPPIGQLPVLKYLSIDGMAGVKSIGSEFYGCSGSAPFPSLETLHFLNLKVWEDWIPPNQEVEVFPQLRELFLVNCSKLLGSLPKRFPLLEKLVIRKCEQLLVSIPSIPTLCKLEINGCRKVVLKIRIDPSLSNLVISSDMSEQVFPPGLLKHELPNLKELTIKNTSEATCLWQTGAGLLQDISSLQRLTISSFPQFFSLKAEEEEMQEQPGLQCRLHYLELSDCQSLVKLPTQALLSLVSLKRIKISDCDSLESFPKAWMHNTNISLESLYISCCNSLTCITSARLPPSLKQMEIRGCKNLRTLIDEDEVSSTELKEDINCGYGRCASFLEQLVIIDCPSLISLSLKSEMPATLERIHVDNCSTLSFLSSRGNLPKALKDLWISHCSELESVAEGLDNTTSLETIFISNCENLRLLPNNLYKARHLQSVELRDCPKLVSFPEGGLQACTKLTLLSISRCENLKTLPNGMHNVTSLNNLDIFNCPSIELCSFEDAAIFPTNIPSLRICYMKIYRPWYERRLHGFTSITTLFLSGACSDHLVSFPPEENIKVELPASLRTFGITNFQNLKRLGSIFETLTSLECLRLYNCPKLEYFPQNGLPSSLFGI